MARKKFKLVGGAHTELDGTRYSKGDVVETHEDLDKKWVGKFERLREGEDEEASAPTPSITVSIGGSSKSSKDEKSDGKKAKGVEDARGDDVTDEFKLDKSLKVFQRGEYFHLYEGKKTKPINDRGLKTDKEVEAAAKSWLDE